MRKTYKIHLVKPGHLAEQVGTVMRGESATYAWLREHAHEIDADPASLVEVWERCGLERWELFERQQLADFKR